MEKSHDFVKLGSGRRRDYRPRSFPEVFRETVERYGDRTALVFQGERVSYAELAERIGKVRSALDANGIEPGRRVALLLDPSPALIATLLAILDHGCSFVPISNKEAPERITFALEDSGAAILITERHYRRRIPPHDCPLMDIGAAFAPEAPGAPLPAATIDPSDEAYVIYTSGTTGRPKGVRIAHRSLVHFGESISLQYAAGRDDVVLYFYSPSVDTSLEEICLAFFNGATLCIASEAERHSPAKLSALMAGNRVSLAILPLKVAAEMDPRSLPDLRLVIFGGEPVHAETVNRWQAGGREVYNGYGPTEATVAVTQMRCAGTYDNPPPIGRPMDNHLVLLIDPETGEPAEPGGIGEIAVAGPGVSLGYLNRDDLTRERFIPNRWVDDPLWPTFYLTGDFGRFDGDGMILFLGRRDHQVKIGGHRVEISEVENALLSHDLVEFAVVDVKPKKETSALVAYIKMKPGNPKLDSYWDYMKSRLPFYMIPSETHYISEIPLSRSGKVDRARLHEFVAG